MFMDISELKKIIEGSDVVMGTDRTLKLLKQNKVDRILLSNDSDSQMMDRIRKISQKVEVMQVDKSKEDFKEICKTQFNISVIGIISGKKSAKKAK